MDLGAYINIEDVDIGDIVKRNGIYCPRLRGYRLMKCEEPIIFSKLTEGMETDIAMDLCMARPLWSPNPHTFELSFKTDMFMDYYIPKDETGERHIRWDRIRGKKRKILKTAIHNKYVQYRKQYDVWNKYAGRADILYIHARIGGGNWPSYYKKVVDQPWFIEKVDDAYDSTYCDIYARIK